MKAWLIRITKSFLVVLAYLILSLIGPGWVYYTGDIDLKLPWYAFTNSESKINLDSVETNQAVVRIYAARAYNWRGLFAVHPWLLIKEKGLDNFQRIEILGWRQGSLGKISIKNGGLDSNWFGNPAELVHELSGRQAEIAIPKIYQLIKDYPYKEDYKAYPGPNSNTFMSYIVENTNEIVTTLPPLAIGQRYPIEGKIISWSTDPIKFQISLWGHFGFVIGQNEGVRFFLFGVEWGINPWLFKIVIPGIGVIG